MTTTTAMYDTRTDLNLEIRNSRFEKLPPEFLVYNINKIFSTGVGDMHVFVFSLCTARTHTYRRQPPSLSMLMPNLATAFASTSCSCVLSLLLLPPCPLKVMQDDQKLMVEFQDYPNVLIRMLNNCIKEPHSHLAVFVMQHDVNARLDFIQVRSLSEWFTLNRWTGRLLTTTWFMLISLGPERQTSTKLDEHVWWSDDKIVCQTNQSSLGCRTRMWRICSICRVVLQQCYTML